MYVCILDLNTYCKDNFYFLDTKPNIVVEGIFTKVIYTDQSFTLNGTYFSLPLAIESNSGSDNYVHFNPTTHQNNRVIKTVNELELTILDNYCQFSKLKKKTPVYFITKHLNCGKFKINFREYHKTHRHFILKISGIWETNTEYGVTYKIIEGTHLFT